MRHLISFVASRTGIALGAALLVWGVPESAYAVDGVIEINQARALAGNVTAGDTAGFPVTLSEAGSYRLTGNLTVPNENTTAITISSSDVTIDLNGFAILGVTTCTFSAGSVTCSPTGTGDGIRQLGSERGLTVRNGTIRGMGQDGFNLLQVKAIDLQVSQNGRFGVGASSLSTVTRVTATVNGVDGIITDFSGTVISDCLAANNGERGIDGFLGARAVVLVGNTVIDNGTDGIACGTGCIVRGNFSYGNSGSGLLLGSDSVYTGNVVASNGATVTGGINLDHNSCNGTTTCP